METYPRAAVERAMKTQEVIMRAIAEKITWAQAGEIMGLAAPTQVGRALQELGIATRAYREPGHTAYLAPCLPQIEKAHWRATLAGCRDTIYEQLDGTWTIGPRIVGRYNREGLPLQLETMPQRKPLGVGRSRYAPPASPDPTPQPNP